MSIRKKAALIIFSVVFAVNAASLISCLVFTHITAPLSVLFLVFGGITAVFLSEIVARPFVKIEEQDAKIREANKRTNLLLNAMPLTCHLWNKDLKIFECNDESIRLFKTKNKEEFLNSFFTFSPEYQSDGQLSSEKAAMLIKKTFEEGRCVSEWMHQLSDGSPLPAEVILVRVEYENDYVIAGYLRDLREQKLMMKEIEEANRAKSDFLANMSHEMRTPLNAIIGLSELCLNSGELSHELNSNIEKIYNAGRTLLYTVNDILDISKIEAGKLELVANEYALPSLIYDTITQNIIRIGEKPIKFILNINEDLPSCLYGDEIRIKQILNNILSNAFKYTQEGKVELSIEISDENSADSVWMILRVRDTGIGIKEEDMKKLFTTYTQVNAKSINKIEGTGLGLSITKKIVEMMDGSVTLESEYGKGSIFTVKVKQKMVNTLKIGPEVVKNLKNFNFTDLSRRKNSRLNRKKMPNAKVLVVDDVPTNLDVATGMMGLYGLKIDCVCSGQEAVDAIREEKTRYDAIFMDHMMPEMDGIEAARIIREEIGTEYARNIPIIALTANAIVGNENIFLSNGFQAFISKPIDAAMLDTVLNTWIHDKPLPLQAPPEHEMIQAAGLPEPSAELDLSRPLLNGGAILGNIHVEGVDFIQGLRRYSNEKTYLNVIRSFCLHTPALLKKLRSFIGDETEKNHEKIISLSDYTIIIHGLKGSCYNISANIAGIEAKELETAAKAGDIELITRKTLSFISLIESLLNNLGMVLQKAKDQELKKHAASPDSELFSRLFETSKFYKAAEMEQIIRELESYEYESGGELVSWLREQMDNLRYDVICSRLEKEISNV